MRIHEERATDCAPEILRLAVRTRIEEVVGEIEPPGLRQAIEHGVYNGKMVRPVLTLLSCAAVGGKPDAALDAATAVELLHTSSLLHDDIMDSSVLRRGKSTVHAEYGIPMAILAGDTLISLAFQLVGNARQQPERIHMIFAESFRNICEGQGYDISLSAADSNATAVERMAEKKTAKLFQAACEIGALIGTKRESHIEAIRSFGRNLGMAFQIRDDILDATGDEHTMGKPARIDWRNGRRTYVTAAVVDTRQCATTKSGPVAALMQEFTRSACDALEKLPPGIPQAQLRRLAASLLDREQ